MKIRHLVNTGKTNPIQSQYKANQSQYKPNFRKARMNLNFYLTKDYENKWQWRVRKNKPNSNPIKPNFKRDTLLLCGALLRTSGRAKYEGFTVLFFRRVPAGRRWVLAPASRGPSFCGILALGVHRRFW